MEVVPKSQNSTSSRKRTLRGQQHEGPPLHNFCTDHWTWNKWDKSPEVRLQDPFMKTAHFHPNWSNGTAGVRGTRALSRGGRHYWEVHVTQRIFGTSMMFGIGTKRCRLHIDAFVNMLGEDEHGWGLSHKGLLWHAGQWRQYARPFRENEAATLGLLFDGARGTLTYYKDGACLGVAFSDLHRVREELYPVVCSTAAKTEMALGVTRREFADLQDRCRARILALLRRDGDIERLRLPGRLRLYLVEDQEVDHVGEPRRGPPADNHHQYFVRSSDRAPDALGDVKNFLFV